MNFKNLKPAKIQEIPSIVKCFKCDAEGPYYEKGVFDNLVAIPQHGIFITEKYLFCEKCCEHIFKDEQESVTP